MNHAYLIVAHNNPRILVKLLKALDYENNDIFLHIDKKAHNLLIHLNDVKLKNAKLFIFSRVNVKWGHYSLILVEKELLTESTKTFHDYYHLISGVDLPIKNHKEIEDFFSTNNGREFVEIIEGYSKRKIYKRN